MARPLLLKDPRLSPEVRQYLQDSHIPFPNCPPAILTPEPRDYPGAVFSYERVDKIRNVFHLLRHTQGEWSGRPLDPDPWQIAYILAPIFGWVAPNENGELVRIIRKVWIEVPRKNGKTTLAGGIACYLMAADGEPGAQVYAVATGKQQARYCFDPVKLIAKGSPDLKPYVRITNDRIAHVPSGSFFAAVSSLADLLFGANVFGGMVDEVHVHPDGKLIEAVESGMAARREPLMCMITTADDSRQDTIYAQRRQRIEQLADRIFKDPSTFGVIWQAGKEDDPFDERTWKKANPGYGISPTRNFMINAANQAQQSPANRASFLRLHLNRRTKQETRYIEVAPWNKKKREISPASLQGQMCFGGLDLAATSDLCALCWVFPIFPELDQDGNPIGLQGHRALWRIWIPEGDEDSKAGLIALRKRTAEEAQVWVDQGWITVTPGAIADYDFIRKQINDDRERFNVREIAYDPYNATQLVTDLMGDGVTMWKTRQGFGSMSAPTKEFQRLINGKPSDPGFWHDGNPVALWAVDNLAVETDAQGNVKPSRELSGGKIDPVVAAILGLDRAMRNEDLPYDVRASVY